MRAQKCHEGEEVVELNGKITCTSETNHGEIASSKGMKNIAVTFKGCELEFAGSFEKCKNTTMWSKGALSLTNTDKAPEAIEIKAN